MSVLFVCVFFVQTDCRPCLCCRVCPFSFFWLLLIYAQSVVRVFFLLWEQVQRDFAIDGFALSVESDVNEFFCQ